MTPSRLPCVVDRLRSGGRSAILPVLLLAMPVLASAEAPPVLFPQPLSPRNASYAIEVSLDPGAHVLSGVETLRWRNVTRDPAPDLLFHLYMNGFANGETLFMRESRGQHRQFRFDEEHWGYVVVRSIVLADGGRKVALEQDFPGPDRTVMRTRLPSPVLPGASIEVRVEFEAHLPKVFARTGWAGSFHLAGQWFPKLGVWEEGRGWNCHPFHYASEFYSDFGVYDVAIDVPDDQIVGATGVAWGEKRDRPGRKTLLYHAEDVHDFAFAASPRFVERIERWGAIEIRILMQPENAGSIPRYAEAAKRALAFLGEKLGPYPYSVLTIVDPPAGGGGAGGMEYPTLVTGAASPAIPRALRIPEIAIAHEVAHQYWYGMSANNEFEEAWLDEGLTTYAETRIVDAWFGPDRSILDGPFALGAGEVGLQRMGYLPRAEAAPVRRRSWEYPDFEDYGAMSYLKPALILETLESLEGVEKVDRLLRAFFERARFRHPTTGEFLDTAREDLGPGIEALVERLLEGTDTVDFEVLAVVNPGTEPFRGYDLTKRPPALVTRAEDAPGAAAAGRLAEVWIGRSGGIALPVTVRVTFSDGTTRDETWDGAGTEKVFRYAGRRISKVEVDPEGRIPLERSRLDDGWREEADRGPADRLVARARWLLQSLFSAALAAF